MASETPTLTHDRIRAWLEADDGEPEIGLSAHEHAAQTAEQAIRAGADDELVVAALLHDLGHAEAGHDHGRWAREHLSSILSERVLWLIEHHITAKRYACTVDPTYHDKLSEDSKRTLVLQGGTLSAAGAAAFARHRWFADVMRLREWDEGAKLGGWMPRPLDEYLAYVDRAVGRER